MPQLIIPWQSHEAAGSEAWHPVRLTLHFFSTAASPSPPRGGAARQATKIPRKAAARRRPSAMVQVCCSLGTVGNLKDHDCPRPLRVTGGPKAERPTVTVTDPPEPNPAPPCHVPYCAPAKTRKGLPSRTGPSQRAPFESGTGAGAGAATLVRAHLRFKLPKCSCAVCTGMYARTWRVRLWFPLAS
jgi:hypothetical protein